MLCDRLPLGHLHLIADADVLAATNGGQERVIELLARGLPSLQLRAVGRSVEEFTRWAGPLRDAAAQAGAICIVNGPLAAADVLEADGVHVPARLVRTAPTDRPWGASAHSLAELDHATGASWLFLSPVFASESKPGQKPLGLARFAELAGNATAPVYALGGVTRENAAACREAGAAGLACIRGLLTDDGESWLAETPPS